MQVFNDDFWKNHFEKCFLFILATSLSRSFSLSCCSLSHQSSPFHSHHNHKQNQHRSLLTNNAHLTLPQTNSTTTLTAPEKLLIWAEKSQIWSPTSQIWPPKLWIWPLKLPPNSTPLQLHQSAIAFSFDNLATVQTMARYLYRHCLFKPPSLLKPFLSRVMRSHEPQPMSHFSQGRAHLSH